MAYFDNIRTWEDAEKPVAAGGMSMGEGGLKPRGWPNSCPDSELEDGRHLMRVLSCVQSVEHFKCEYCGDEEWD